jgi:hypothetical protein
VLTCRGPSGTPPTEPGSRAVAEALAGHPLAGKLTGTIVIGITGASPWRATDLGPRVAVLIGHDDLTRVQRAHLALADGIVMTEPSQARAATAAAPTALLAIASGDGREFLRGSTPRQAAAAWDEVARHRELAQAIGGGERADLHARAAELALELVIALRN